MTDRVNWIVVSLTVLFVGACDTGGGSSDPDTHGGDTQAGDVAVVQDSLAPEDSGGAPDSGGLPDGVAQDASSGDAVEGPADGETADAEDALQDAVAEDAGASDALADDAGLGDVLGDVWAEDGATSDIWAEDVASEDISSEDAGMEDVGGEDVSEDAGPVEPPFDCAHIPEGPFQLVKLQGPVASEDIAFDKEGHVVGSNDKAIFKSYYGGTPQVFVPKLSFRAGMRYLPNGHLVVCDNEKGQLVRVDEKGEIHPLLTGLSYPNGIVVDLAGWVYFTEHDANKVWRVHPFTGDKQLLTTKISNPNGITFSPDYKTMYIGGFSGVGTVYAMSISPDGVPGKLIDWATNVGTGWLDGMGVDVCGNVYIADYNATIIYRISPDGKTKTPIIFGASQGAYLPNMDWGSGLGGWENTNLYFPNGWAKEVFEVKLGIPPKERPYP